MSRFQSLMTAALATVLVLSARANAQSTSAAGPHTIVVKLVEKGGSMPYAFDPASSVVARGDTVRFMEAAAVIHNVRFTKVAPGAKLGASATGPYLSTKGQTYDVVIDQRFTDGTYEFVCDPHAAIGMKGTLVVKGSAASN